MRVYIDGLSTILVVLMIAFNGMSVSAQSQIEDIRQEITDLQTRIDSLTTLLNELLQATIVVDSPHVYFGVAGPRGLLRDKEYFYINHNDDWRIPYWVAHHLTAEDLAVTRDYSGRFRADTTIPRGRRAELEDYAPFSSTFDRGHMAPEADFVRSKEAMAATYILSNVIPQYRNFNRGLWSQFEKQVRKMVKEKGQVWIVTGPVFMNEDSVSVGPNTWIGEPDTVQGKGTYLETVAVPTHAFKALLALDNKGVYTTYAFLMPNLRKSEGKKAKEYIISVNRLEEITGYDFFPGLDDDIEDDIEDQNREWVW